MAVPDERANAARMYDYMLGGGHNFAVDRERVKELVAQWPDVIRATWETRAYLRRVVEWCTTAGIDQFLDLGSGVPTVGNVHEVAHRTIPDARVAYVDHEPVAAAAAREVTADLPTVSITEADLRDTAAVLAAPGVADLLDLDRPVAVLALAVLHFVPGDLVEVLDPYLSRLVPGSVLAIGHASDDRDDNASLTADLRTTAGGYSATASPLTLRTRSELHALLAPLDVVPPGLVDIVDWPTARPDVARAGGYGAIGRVPAATDTPPPAERR